MNESRLQKIIGAVVFLIAAFTYFSTVQPSVSFWDCGEFIASSFLMQVPHPPGTPFFLILGRFLSMIPFAENIGLRVNTISVLSSAFTILFLYLIIIKTIENFTDKKHRTFTEALGTYLAAAIGALSLAFADTFWFNAVEAEVYALSTLFIALVVWLMMLWNERADRQDNEKYLIMIAYLIGLSTGVHLMAVLSIVPIVMVIMFRKYQHDENALKKSANIFVIHAVVILLVAAALWSTLTGTTPPMPEEYKEVDLRFLMIFVAVSVLFMGVLWKKIFHKNSFYLPLIVGGIALMVVYPGIVKHVPNLIASIGGSNELMDAVIFSSILALLGYLIYWSSKERKETLNLLSKSFLFAFLGFTTYTMIIIRANQDPPINLNSPKTFPEVVSYLNREQYGDFPTFKRRFSQEPHQQSIYTNYSSDLDFLVRYQMNHMFHRYLFWNYVGRESTVQDAGVDWTQFFYIPLLLGIWGMIFHFRKDWRMASVFLVMFIFLGYLTAFYQNQQQPQPRERDYFYVGAFFVYSLWIGLGVKGIFELLKQSIKHPRQYKIAFYAVVVFGFLLVPFNMAKTNWFTHDRSRNYVPWDYSYNLLQSVAPNAVIFTNGDNDTFPLWYLQDVEGVRQDVRIANLSLLNTDWYVKQLKNTTPHGAMKIKFSFSNAEIDRLGPMRWNPKMMSVPVPKKVYEQFGVTDTSVINSGKITWLMNNTVTFGNVKAVRVQDLAVLDIIQANQWERPIYFAVTCSEKSKIGLSDYLKMEGLAFRIVPYKVGSYYESVDEELMRKQLFNEPEGYSKDYQPGFKFRGLNDPDVFLDENHRRLTINYRNAFIRLALHYLYVKNDNEMTIKTLDKMEEKIPREHIPVDYRLLNDVASIYWSAGAKEQYLPLAREVEKKCLLLIDANPDNVRGDYNPYFMLKQIYDNLGEYDKFVQVLRKLQAVRPGDKSVQQLIDEYIAKSKSKNKNDIMDKKTELNN